MNYRIQGLSIHAEVHGTAEPALVFLHYWGGTSRTWRHVTAELEGQFKTVAYDARGWGKSDKTLAGYKLADLADEALALVKALGIKQYVLVGHSMGGQQLTWLTSLSVVLWLVSSIAVPKFFPGSDDFGHCPVERFVASVGGKFRVPASFCRSYGSQISPGLARRRFRDHIFEPVIIRSCPFICDESSSVANGGAGIFRRHRQSLGHHTRFRTLGCRHWPKVSSKRIWSRDGYFARPTLQSNDEFSRYGLGYHVAAIGGANDDCGVSIALRSNVERYDCGGGSLGLQKREIGGFFGRVRALGNFGGLLLNLSQSNAHRVGLFSSVVRIDNYNGDSGHLKPRLGFPEKFTSFPEKYYDLISRILKRFAEASKKALGEIFYLSSGLFVLVLGWVLLRNEIAPRKTSLGAIFIGVTGLCLIFCAQRLLWRFLDLSGR